MESRAEQLGEKEAWCLMVFFLWERGLPDTGEGANTLRHRREGSLTRLSEMSPKVEVALGAQER